MLKIIDIAEEIAYGHAFEKHILAQGEFTGNIKTRQQFQKHIEMVLDQPTMIRKTGDERIGIWHEETSSMVIYNPRASDGGTAFQPDIFIDYLIRNFPHDI